MVSKGVWEVALTVLVAIILLAAAEGGYPCGFYIALRTAATVGGGLLGDAGVSVGATGLDVGLLGYGAPTQPDLAGKDAPGGLAANRPDPRPTAPWLVRVLVLAHTPAGLICTRSIESLEGEEESQSDGEAPQS